MSNLPFGMQEDVEITFSIEGTATDVLADLRALRSSGTNRKAHVHVLTIRATDRRGWSEEFLPPIVNGDSALVDKI